MSQKYPRSPHLPWSPGGTNDDRRLASVEHFLGEPLILTEKMDGSNVCLEACQVFARSHVAAPKHPSFDALKSLHAAVKRFIPEGVQIFAEWCYAKHSIGYTALPHYLLVFGVRTGSQWASWSEVQLWAQELQVPTVPLLLEVTFEPAAELQKHVELFASAPSLCGGDREGVVVRLAREFSDAEFPRAVAKHVRKDHVQTDDHWSHQVIFRNGVFLG